MGEKVTETPDPSIVHVTVIDKLAPGRETEEEFDARTTICSYSSFFLKND